MTEELQEVNGTPGFDGMGRRGEGAVTGRGEGNCTLAQPESGEVPYGYAGLQAAPRGD